VAIWCVFMLFEAPMLVEGSSNRGSGVAQLNKYGMWQNCTTNFQVTEIFLIFQFHPKVSILILCGEVGNCVNSNETHIYFVLL